MKPSSSCKKKPNKKIVSEQFGATLTFICLSGFQLRSYRNSLVIQIQDTYRYNCKLESTIQNGQWPFITSLIYNKSFHKTERHLKKNNVGICPKSQFDKSVQTCLLEAMAKSQLTSITVCWLKNACGFLLKSKQPGEIWRLDFLTCITCVIPSSA